MYTICFVEDEEDLSEEEELDDTDEDTVDGADETVGTEETSERDVTVFADVVCAYDVLSEETVLVTVKNVVSSLTTSTVNESSYFYLQKACTIHHSRGSPSLRPKKTHSLHKQLPLW